VRRFARKHTAVIYKSTSGTRSIVKRLTKERMKSLRDIAWCPTQFQEWVPGTDFRVHVIGNEIYSCAIESNADDYRYNSLSMRVCALPRDIEARCFRLARQLKLPLCGIDLRLTPAGEWYCFEVNPSPAYSCFEGATETSMDSAIARLLIEADAEPNKQFVFAA
jgi:glutathione synthase/RimK-type ligase-like ATP-grasp enzyme